MLQVDLGQLDRRHRLRIEASIPASHALWAAAEWKLSGPLDVRLEAQRAGRDVVVRGELAGTAELPCRRCLAPVTVPFEEEVTFLFRAGLDPHEADEQDSYALPRHGTVLDVTEAVREHVFLLMPGFVLCRQTCRGICHQCGTDWNEASCDCATTQVDERWAALRRLAKD